jgi:phasin family protein
MPKKTGNPILDTDFSNYLNLDSLSAAFKLPGVDSEALIQAQKKNFEAVAKANRVAFEGAQALAQRQAEIFRQAMEDSLGAFKELTATGSTEDRIAKQAEVAKRAFETAVVNSRELADMGAKSNGKAVELINARVAEGLDEFKAAVKTVA